MSELAPDTKTQVAERDRCAVGDEESFAGCGLGVQEVRNGENVCVRNVADVYVVLEVLG